MGRPERSLDPSGGVASQLAAQLRRLRRDAGSPGYRRLAAVAHYSATTLSDAASGRRIPSLAVTLAYARACGASATEWEARWRAAMTAISAAAALGRTTEPSHGGAVTLVARWTVEVDAAPLAAGDLHGVRTDHPGGAGIGALVENLNEILGALRDAQRPPPGRFGPPPGGRTPQTHRRAPDR